MTREEVEALMKQAKLAEANMVGPLLDRADVLLGRMMTVEHLTELDALLAKFPAENNFGVQLANFRQFLNQVPLLLAGERQRAAVVLAQANPPA